MTNEASYSPLSLPALRTRGEMVFDCLLTGFTRSTRARNLATQLRRRTAISREVWGPSPDRQKLASKISEIIQKEIGWPNANFIPEDPMRLVLFKLDSEGLFWDHMELEFIFYGIEDVAGRALTDDEFRHMFNGTFGEAVDLLLDINS
jgi:hypothetical protein